MKARILVSLFLTVIFSALSFMEVCNRGEGLGLPTFVAAYLLLVIIALYFLNAKNKFASILIVTGLVLFQDLISILFLVVSKLNDMDSGTLQLNNSYKMLFPVYIALVLSRVAILITAISKMHGDQE